MGKKRYRSNYTSKGQRDNVCKDTLRRVRRGLTPIDKMENKIRAWKAGLDPYITVPGPSKKFAYIKVKASTFWGDHKRRPQFIEEDESE